MAHITSQSATQGESQQHSVPSEDLEDSDSSKEGTPQQSVSDSVSSTMSPNSFMAEEKPEILSAESGDCASGSLEDTSCSVKNKNNRDKRSKGIENSSSSSMRSECRGTIKAGADEDSAVSGVLAELEEGCVTLNLATTMERVNPDLYAYGGSGSPYPSSENEWEASDHSDTDADHSDSSDDDNPTSQVDRMIERGARLIMDGENSNLSSETDDTDDDEFDDDSDSDITDVSPLVSNAASPLGLSPVMCRRNLPSSISSRPPFMRHYSHKGHEGDVEDEIEDENICIKKWTTEDIYNNTDDNAHLDATNSPNMSLVVQALLKISLESRQKSLHNSNDNLDHHTDNRNDNQSHHHHHQVPRNKHHHNLSSSALNANPHHRHLRKTNNSRRKNMSFTNEEARIIDRDNSIILEKLLAVNNRDDTMHTIPAHYRLSNKPANATIARRRKDENIQKENLAILRRLQDVKPSRAVTAATTARPASTHTSSSARHHHQHHHQKSQSSHHHHHHHHHPPHHHHHHQTAAARSCSVTARQATEAFSPPHHSPKETAL